MTSLEGLFTDPYLPDVGDIYWVDTEILNRYDKKPRRPAVVVEVPTTINGRIKVVTRTTEPGIPGVPHDAVEELELYEDGTFAYLRTVEARLWRRPHVEWMGRLDEDVLKIVIEEVLG